ncbi:hypothetical protein PIB30_091834 [Stylosanthes scabra]|uniref:Uncharacterized protein n=1 Tax=Stylosanthes scabra TaxID=79078 RepID=A0ABU6QUU5_9FABA|nr:hypothetical protein [Stylosanthes scabra]
MQLAKRAEDEPCVVRRRAGLDQGVADILGGMEVAVTDEDEEKRVVGMESGDEGAVVPEDPLEEVEGGEWVEVEGEERGEGGGGDVTDLGFKERVFSPFWVGEDGEELGREIGVVVNGIGWLLGKRRG